MSKNKNSIGIDDISWFEFTEKLPYLTAEEIKKELTGQMEEVLKKFE